MILNVLYSLFFHLIVILLIYFNFNFHKLPENEENKMSVTVSFIVKKGNSENVTNQILKTTKAPDPEAKEVKKEIKKPVAVKKKIEPKKVKKAGKSKPNLTDVKVKNTESAKKPPEEIVKKTLKTPPVPEKKEPIKLVKKEQKPKIIKEEIKEDPRDNDEEEDIEDDVKDTPSNSEYFEDKQKLENIDLSVREKFNVQLQIRRCYKRAITEAKKDTKSTVNIHIVIDQDGTIDLDQAKILGYERYNDPKEKDFHNTVDNVKRALTLCSPLRNLPEDKYEIWQELNLQFDDETVTKE